MAVLQGPINEAAVSSQRARELYRYFQPPRQTVHSSKLTSPDTVLTAHSQLVAWRLNAQRAMVSLIDRDTQYFVAESTKTLNLGDTTLQEDPEDALWAGCASVPKAGRLCEHTIAALPPPDGRPAYFEVLDLTKDSRFNQLPFVTGPPNFKWYCGVPLRTKKGISIGSLFALDDKIRPASTQAQLDFLATMADNVMSHFENQKEKEDRKRASNMNLCLAAFVDPEHQVRKRKRTQPSQSDLRPRSKPSTSGTQNDHFEDGPRSVKSPNRTKPARRPASSTQRTDKNGSASSNSEVTTGDSDSSVVDDRVGEHDHLEVFKRAADLLHEALALDDVGGVVFVDSGSGIYRKPGSTKLQSDESSDDQPEARRNYKRRGSLGNVTLRSASSWDPQQTTETGERRSPNSRSVEILATKKAVDLSDRHEDSEEDATAFTSLAQNDLIKLIKRHSRGKLFNLDPEGILGSSSSSEEKETNNAYDMPKSKKITHSKAESKLLFKHFPGARQVIFLPLWDASTSRFSAFFAYNCSEFREFSNNPDFLYCIAFCNCVMTEITRQATIAADQQKGDFIGSISHELRSPLHGILASCEFLAETETNSFQQSLVDTADSCARTLLDTINMVLDYSKINAFERNAHRAHRKRSIAGTGLADGQLQPSMNIYGDVDLAAITEEVVEGVATGQVFKDSLTGDDIRQHTIDGSANKSGKDIEIILEIASRKSIRDWIFVTQPGAFRRIVMNIFGNALKYTCKGFIKVKLTAEGPEDRDQSGNQSNETIIRLQVTDTGQGMSAHFMRTKLFLPFSQENALSSGTGLGLSLVRSLVNMLNGDITIQSTKDVGTQVMVTLPMSRSSPSGSASTSTPSSAGSIERIKDDSLLVVQHKAKGRTAMLFPRTSSNDIRKLMRETVAKYITDWFHLTLLDGQDLGSKTDIVITDEIYVPQLLKAMPTSFNNSDGPMFIVLCTTDSRRSERNAFFKSPSVEAVSHPFGPYKLAKSLRRCLEKIESRAITEMSPQRPAVTGAIREETESEVGEVVAAVEQVTLTNPEDPDSPEFRVIKHGEVMANEDSVHANIVVEGAQVTDSSSGSDQRGDFPFPEHQPLPIPSPLDDGTVSPSLLEAEKASEHRPALIERRTLSPNNEEIKVHHAAAVPATPISSMGAITTHPTAEPGKPMRSPRLLIVDDNKVNLRLLETYLKKRKYTDIYSAEDGAQAVAVYAQMLNPTAAAASKRNSITSMPPPSSTNAAPPFTHSRSDENIPASSQNHVVAKPPDIIFMDISMPIMDGFEATRRIRALESSFRDSLSSPYDTPPSSLIIALTGLASGRDQSEAFMSGFDLYLVKPISFREVGRLLDNWERAGASATVGNGTAGGTGERGKRDVGAEEVERAVEESGGRVPHGPVTADTTVAGKL